MPSFSCPECGGTDIARRQFLGSEILWFICGTCADVWCAIVPPLSYSTGPTGLAPVTAASPRRARQNAGGRHQQPPYSVAADAGAAHRNRDS